MRPKGRKLLSDGRNSREATKELTNFQNFHGRYRPHENFGNLIFWGDAIGLTNFHQNFHGRYRAHGNFGGNLIFVLDAFDLTNFQIFHGRYRAHGKFGNLIFYFNS